MTTVRRASAVWIAAACCAAAGFAAPPGIERVSLYERETGGYAIYRIPGIIGTKAGTLLAYNEARRTDRGDWVEIDLLLRRSTDGGRTWSAPVRVGQMAGAFPKNPAAVAKKQGEGAGVTYNNPVAIADRNGTVHFLFCVEYMRAFYMRSTDDGRTFSDPVEITGAFEAFRPEFAWVVLATGPGHGIQLRNGRLIVPVWLSLGTGSSAHGSSVTSVIYSDDHGATWKRGDIAVPDTPEWPSPNETAAAQLSDGRVMLNVRAPSPRQRRIVVTSKDGATNWSRPEYQEELFEPVCFASLLKLRGRRLLFVNPDSGSRERKNLTVRLSNDDGKTWSVKRVLEPGPAGYADLAVLPDGTIVCLYEAGRQSLVAARFNLEWLKR